MDFKRPLSVSFRLRRRLLLKAVRSKKRKSEAPTTDSYKIVYIRVHSRQYTLEKILLHRNGLAAGIIISIRFL